LNNAVAVAEKHLTKWFFKKLNKIGKPTNSLRKYRQILIDDPIRALEITILLPHFNSVPILLWKALSQ